MSETANGVAGQAQLAADGPQADTFVEQRVDRFVPLTEAIRRAPRPARAGGFFHELRVVQGHERLVRYEGLRLWQQGSVLDNGLLNRLDEVLPDGNGVLGVRVRAGPVQLDCSLV